MVNRGEHLPDPPPDLDAWDIPSTNTVLPMYRCHATARDPIHMNRGAMGRFNAPAGEYGVMYVATDPYGAFIETFGQSIRRDGRGVNVVPAIELARRCLCRIDVVPDGEPFRFVDLSGSGLSRLGADGRLTTMTDDRRVPQRWALALYRHPSRPDGLVYRLRHDQERLGVALFDRVIERLGENHGENVLEVEDVLGPILTHYRFATDESEPRL